MQNLGYNVIEKHGRRTGGLSILISNQLKSSIGMCEIFDNLLPDQLKFT